MQDNLYSKEDEEFIRGCYRMKNSEFWPLILRFIEDKKKKNVKEMIKIKHTDKNALFYEVAKAELIQDFEIFFRNIDASFESMDKYLNEQRKKLNIKN